MKVETIEEFLSRGGEIKRCEIRETTHKDIFNISGRKLIKPTKEEIKKSKKELKEKGKN